MYETVLGYTWAMSNLKDYKQNMVLKVPEKKIQGKYWHWFLLQSFLQQTSLSIKAHKFTIFMALFFHRANTVKVIILCILSNFTGGRRLQVPLHALF